MLKKNSVLKFTGLRKTIRETPFFAQISTLKIGNGALTNTYWTTNQQLQNALAIHETYSAEKV